MITGRPLMPRRAGARLTSLALLLAVVGLPQPVHAQLVTLETPPLVTKYAFRVPIKKVVVNPCTAGFELITGNLDFSITTTKSLTSGFGIGTQVASAGIGEDALASGLLILNGTQKPHYTYAYSTGFDASFPETPLDFAATTAVTDYLVRGSTVPGSDSFILNTVFELVFTSGVPTAPVVKELNVVCASDLATP
jgi:hypothetical protein